MEAKFEQHVLRVFAGPRAGLRVRVVLLDKRGAGAGSVRPSTLDEGAARREVRMQRRFGQRQHRREAGVAAFEPSHQYARGCVFNSAATRARKAGQSSYTYWR